MNFYEQVYQTVKKVPRGKVATYGQIAALIGSPRSARMVGWAMHAMDGGKLEKIPWQRIINRKGHISTTCETHPAMEQANILQREKIKVSIKDGNYFVDLDKYLWQPK